MKNGVIIINNARGGVVNEQDLVKAVLNGDIAGAAADVACRALTSDHPYVQLQKNDNFLLTPHQAWMSHDCLIALVKQFGENLEAFHKGESLRRIV